MQIQRWSAYVLALQISLAASPAHAQDSGFLSACRKLLSQVTGIALKVDTDLLVPNTDPAEEFMRIGPNLRKVSEYRAMIHETGTLDEPIMVEQLKNGTYRIQNGHHRWMAAKQAGLKKVPIEIIGYEK